MLLGDGTLFEANYILLIILSSSILICHVNVFSSKDTVMRISSNGTVSNTLQIVAHDVPVTINACFLLKMTVQSFQDIGPHSNSGA